MRLSNRDGNTNLPIGGVGVGGTTMKSIHYGRILFRGTHYFEFFIFVLVIIFTFFAFTGIRYFEIFIFVMNSLFSRFCAHWNSLL